MNKSYTVFCGSQFGNDKAFEKGAYELGTLIGKSKDTLIYGGGSRGLMGSIADACMLAGGKVIGIIPQHLKNWEAQHNNITELIVVDDMHERKKLIYEKSDIVIILPGGYGTLDELFETLTWNQLKLHHKKIYIINTNGFYNHLIEHIKHMQTTGFLYSTVSETLHIVDSCKEIFI